MWKQLESARLGSAGLANVALETQNVHTKHYAARIPAETNAATNVSETTLKRVVFAGVVRSAHIAVDANVVSNATDFVTLTVSKRTAGGAATTLANLLTNTQALTAFSPQALTLNTNAQLLTVAAGDVITFSGIKSGAGKQLMSGVVSVTVEET